MERILHWISQHKFLTQTLAFLLIVLPSIGLYFAAQLGSTTWMWGLLGVVVVGNLLAILTR